MSIIGEEVPGCRGWVLSPVVISGAERRCALTHVETGETSWVWGGSEQERIQEAQRAIDETYERRWTLMADLIEEGDRRGPNVRSLHDVRIDTP